MYNIINSNNNRNVAKLTTTADWKKVMREYITKRFLCIPFLLFDTRCVQFTLLAVQKFSSSVKCFVLIAVFCPLLLFSLDFFSVPYNFKLFLVHSMFYRQPQR